MCGGGYGKEGGGGGGGERETNSVYVHERRGIGGREGGRKGVRVREIGEGGGERE